MMWHGHGCWEQKQRPEGGRSRSSVTATGLAGTGHEVETEGAS